MGLNLSHLVQKKQLQLNPSTADADMTVHKKKQKNWYKLVDPVNHPSAKSRPLVPLLGEKD